MNEHGRVVLVGGSADGQRVLWGTSQTMRYPISPKISTVNYEEYSESFEKGYEVKYEEYELNYYETGTSKIFIGALVGMSFEDIQQRLIDNYQPKSIED